MESVNLGAAPAPGAKRDAVHVAVIPAIAIRDMLPGERLTNGVVDPFRVGTIKKGEWYWLCLFPGTVTSLRHVWAHPAYPPEPELPEKRRSEADVWAGMGRMYGNPADESQPPEETEKLLGELASGPPVPLLPADFSRKDIYGDRP